MNDAVNNKPEEIHGSYLRRDKPKDRSAVRRTRLADYLPPAKTDTQNAGTLAKSELE